MRCWIAYVDRVVPHRLWHELGCGRLSWGATSLKRGGGCQKEDGFAFRYPCLLVLCSRKVRSYERSWVSKSNDQCSLDEWREREEEARWVWITSVLWVSEVGILDLVRCLRGKGCQR